MNEMKHTVIEVGLYEVNSTVLAVNGKAWIVDPGAEGERIWAILEKENLIPAGILLTHGHFDHIGAVPFLQKRFPELTVYVGEKDIEVLTHPMNQMPPEYPPINMPKNVKSAALLEGTDGIEVIDTPGHTPGGVCYFIPSADDGKPLLLAGDTLFAGSVGRTDLPGGDMPALLSSLKKLCSLPGETTVIPGHGPLTTIARESDSNPFILR